MAIQPSSLTLIVLAAALVYAGFARFDASHCISFLFNPSFENIRLCLADISSHHHHRKPKPAPTPTPSQTICSDFPPNIPPPDTDTTAFLCVDRNGCCNFTSVQSAVNAVANFSSKRTVVWINKGFY